MRSAKFYMERQSAFIGHLQQALATDSPRSALSAAKALGGPPHNPHLVADAAKHGADRTVRALVEGGWAPEVDGYPGQSALRSACAAGNSDLAKFLLRHGADPMSTSARGINALGVCAMLGHVELLTMLLEHPTSKSVLGPLNKALAEACKCDSEASAKGCLALEKAGAQWINEADLAGQTVNCAQLAAFRGPLAHLVGSYPFALALATKHPPRKGRGAWSDWQSLDLSPERRSLAEKAILHAMAPVQEAAQGAAARSLRV